MVQENFQILLNLNRVVLQLCDRENSHLAIFPCSVLFEQERQEHEQTAIMNDPPHVNIATNFRNGVREEVYAFGNEKCHAGCADSSHGLQECLPRTFAFILTPSIGPAEYDGVRFQATETSCLDTLRWKWK